MSLPEIYEIHVTIDHSKTENDMAFIFLCKTHGWKYIKVLNTTGVNRIQTMLSKFCKRDSQQEAITYANELSDVIKNHGIPVLRVKVEAMMDRHLSETLSSKPEIYWEFHLKVPQRSLRDFNSVKELLEGRKYVGLSTSLRSQNQDLIVTIRKADGTAYDVAKIKDETVDILKSAGFHIADKIQAELSVYDSNVEFDVGFIA